MDVSGNRCAVSCILEADVIDTDVSAMCDVEEMWESVLVCGGGGGGGGGGFIRIQ